MKKIKYVNSVPKQFKEYESYIKEVIQNFYDYFKFDCQIKVKFVDETKFNDFETVDCMVQNKSIKKHILKITNSPLNFINYDGGEFFCCAICHEFEHIYDFNQMMNTKLFKFNPCLANAKTFEQKYINTGFGFWTEFYAYCESIRFCDCNKFKREKITFGNLVSNYAEIMKLDKKFNYNKEFTIKDAEKYVDMVDSFIYLCAKFMSSTYVNHSRVPYSKIEKNKQYKKVFSILCGLESKVRRVLKNPYGKKSYDNLSALGLHICKNIRFKVFNVGLVNHKGSIASTYSI